MSKLAHIQRPSVIFDPSNKEHREHYVNFAKTRSWGNCPVKFELIDDESNNLAYAMQRKLVAYYLNKEFKTQISDDNI